MLRGIMDMLDADLPRKIPTVMAAKPDLRTASAQLAPLVTQLAEQGDAVSQDILTRAADELCRLVGTVSERLGLGGGYPLGFAGGVILGSELLREQVTAALQSGPYPPGRIVRVPDPVLGCLKLALQGGPR